MLMFSFHVDVSVKMSILKIILLGLITIIIYYYSYIKTISEIKILCKYLTRIYFLNPKKQKHVAYYLLFTFQINILAHSLILIFWVSFTSKYF